MPIVSSTIDDLLVLLLITSTPRHLNQKTLRPRPRILLPRTGPPPPQSKNRKRPAHTNGIIHIRRRNRPHSREEQHDRDKRDPSNGDGVDGSAPAAEREGARDEAHAVAVDVVGEDDGNVGEVQGRGGDVEDCGYGLGRADADKV